MRRVFLLSCVLLAACDPAEPEDVRGVSPGEPTEPDTLTDTSANQYSCADGPAFPEFWAGALEPDMVSATPYDFDAGIGDAIGAMSSNGSFSGPVTITDAVVTAYTEYNGDVDVMWIADSSGGLMSYGVDWGLSVSDVSPGDTISFTATDGTIYFGLPELTEIDGPPTVTGRVDALYVVDGNAEVVTTEDHLSQLVGAYGELVNDEGSCGSSARCYTFSYGENAHTIRVDDALGFSVGDCVQVLMPLGIYFEEEQYSIDNNNWVSTY